MAQVDIERDEILNNEHAEEAELAVMFIEKGVDEEVAREMARRSIATRRTRSSVHAREEFGVDVDDLASPMLAAGSSFLSFALGALFPVFAYRSASSRLAGDRAVARGAVRAAARRHRLTAGRGGSAGSVSCSSAAPQPG